MLHIPLDHFIVLVTVQLESAVALTNQSNLQRQTIGRIVLELQQDF